tara:strand:+ start:8610 stop:8810 length:201 start_codon:yes stop_codon:yes gene_type:complete
LNYNGLVNSEFSRIMDGLYGEKKSPLILYSLCYEVKAAILGGSAYSFKKFKEDIHNKITGDKEDEE